MSFKSIIIPSIQQQFSPLLTQFLTNRPVTLPLDKNITLLLMKLLKQEKSVLFINSLGIKDYMSNIMQSQNFQQTTQLFMRKLTFYVKGTVKYSSLKFFLFGFRNTSKRQPSSPSQCSTTFFPLFVMFCAKIGPTADCYFDPLQNSPQTFLSYRYPITNF